MRRLLSCVLLLCAMVAQAQHLGRLNLSEFGNVLAITVPLDGETFVFYGDGRLNTSQRPLKLDGRFKVSYSDGDRVSAIYAPSGKLSLSYSGSQVSNIYLPEGKISFSYDSQGAVASVYTPKGKLSLSYDSQGRIAKTYGSPPDFDIVQGRLPAPEAARYQQTGTGSSSRPARRADSLSHSPTSMQTMHQQMTAMQESQQKQMEWHQRQAQQYSDLSQVSHSESRTEASSSGTLVIPSRKSQSQSVAMAQPVLSSLLSETRSGNGLGSIQVGRGTALQVLTTWAGQPTPCRVRVSTSSGTDWMLVGDSGLQPAGTTASSLSLADPTLVSGSKLKVQLVDGKGRILATVEGLLP